MRALLFDLDGTLADTDPLHKQAWYEILGEHRVTTDADLYVRAIAGRRNAEIVASLLPHLPPSAGIAVADRKEARFRELAGSTLQGLPGLTQLLELGAQAQWRTALVTNAPRANADLVLTTLGVRFEISIFGEDLPKGKPDPMPYLEALRLLGVAAADAVAFEDSPSGVKSSVTAGIATVGLLTGHPEAELRAAGASLCIADFAASELSAWLRARS